MLKVLEITSACDVSNIVMVNVYLIKRKCFLYCNDGFQRMLGKRTKRLLQEGWDFWFSLVDSKESSAVKNKILTALLPPLIKNLSVLKYNIINANGEKICLKHEMLLHKLEGQILVVNYFYDITVKEKIERYFSIAEDYNDANSSEKVLKTISPREKEVLQLVADGYSSKQIADRLFISNHTAISHRKHLIEKFKVKNTAHLIKRASRNIEFW